MAVSLAVAFAAFRLGLRLRARRLGRTAAAADTWRRHLRVAKPAVLMLVAGFAGGPLSMLALRGRGAFETAHAWLGLLAAALFVAAALLGRRLERAPKGGPSDAHAIVGALALLAGAVAAVAGFVLLP